MQIFETLAIKWQVKCPLGELGKLGSVLIGDALPSGELVLPEPGEPTQLAPVFVCLPHVAAVKKSD